MLTYRDVLLTESGLARNPDGFIFRGNPQIGKRKPIYGEAINDFKYATRDADAGTTWLAYRIWFAILQRCHRSNQITRCCSAWKKFSTFLEWLFEQKYASDFQVDKDILGDGVEYSPSKCVLVPPWVNSLLTDKAKIRGHLPLGVTTNRRMFVAQVNRGYFGERIRAGFDNIEEAKKWYVTNRLEYIHSLYLPLNNIDIRLYPAILAAFFKRENEESKSLSQQYRQWFKQQEEQ